MQAKSKEMQGNTSTMQVKYKEILANARKCKENKWFLSFWITFWTPKARLRLARLG